MVLVISFIPDRPSLQMRVGRVWLRTVFNAQAESRAAAAEEAAASALKTAAVAQAAMQKAQKEALSSIGAANERCVALFLRVQLPRSRAESMHRHCHVSLALTCSPVCRQPTMRLCALRPLSYWHPPTDILSKCKAVIGWRLCRCEEAQELCRQREAELAQARAEAEAFHDALTAERAAAVAAAAALRETLEQQHAAEKAMALGDANVNFRQQLQQQREQLEREVGSKSAQLGVSSP